MCGSEAGRGAEVRRVGRGADERRVSRGAEVTRVQREWWVVAQSEAGPKSVVGRGAE